MNIILGTSPQCATLKTEFIMVDNPSSYNAILEQPALLRIKCIIAGHMLLMKLPNSSGTTTIRGEQGATRQCYNTNITRGHHYIEILSLATPTPCYKLDDPREDTMVEPPHAVEEISLIHISPDHPDRVVKIGTNLSSKIQTE